MQVFRLVMIIMSNEQDVVCRIEEETGIMFRFVVGHSEDALQEAEMGREIAENGAFLRLPVQVIIHPIFLEFYKLMLGFGIGIERWHCKWCPHM